MTNQLTDRNMATSLFEEMRLAGNALELAWLAFTESPAGTVSVALASFEGQNPAGLFLHKLKEGEHLHGGGQRRTGWEMLRGSHGCTYRRNPKGVDVPPVGYGATG